MYPEQMAGSGQRIYLFKFTPAWRFLNKEFLWLRNYFQVKHWDKELSKMELLDIIIFILIIFRTVCRLCYFLRVAEFANS